MGFVSSDEELGVSRDGTFENAVVVFFGGDNGDPLGRLNQMGHGANGPDPSIRLLFAEVELLPQHTAQLGQDKRGEKKIDLTSPDGRKESIRLAPWKGKGGEQYIRIEDDPHAALFPDLMDQPVDIFLRPNPEGLSLQGGLPLEFPPSLLVEVQAQGLPDQLAFGPIFFLGSPLGLADKVGGEGDGPCLGGSHTVTS